MIYLSEEGEIGGVAGSHEGSWSRPWRARRQSSFQGAIIRGLRRGMAALHLMGISATLMASGGVIASEGDERKR